MGGVEASQLSALSWQPPWEVLFLVVALALAQVSHLLKVIILSLTIMNWYRAIHIIILITITNKFHILTLR